MILANGKLLDSAQQATVLATLEQTINHTRATQSLSPDLVIDAVAALGDKIAAGAFDGLIAQLPIEGLGPLIETLLVMLRRETLEYKVRTELGPGFFTPRTTAPPYGLPPLTLRPMPLGTLLHIAAGNVDGLPAYSVAEGLLTGNVNILKLPQADQGLSIRILAELIAIQPALRDFIYVFDTPSSDLPALKQMAGISDGIVLWGGDAAVAAARQFAPLGAKLIEWGHKLGFAYIAGYEDRDAELDALAQHIIATQQLLCSSCQTIFLDTESLDELHGFCRHFLPRLEAAAARHRPTIGAAAEATLRQYNDTLEGVLSGGAAARDRVFRGKGCSLTACADSELALSYLFGHCLVKRLPRRHLFDALRRHKGVLQTAGLLCPPEQRPELTDLLARCGLTRITRAGDLSATFCGEAHDGEYPLRRYTRMVNIQP